MTTPHPEGPLAEEDAEAVSTVPEGGEHLLDTLRQRIVDDEHARTGLYAFSVPLDISEQFCTAVQTDFVAGAEEKELEEPNMYERSAFAEVLRNYWPKFFGHSGADINRAGFVATAHTILPVSQQRVGASLLHSALTNYAVLVDQVGYAKLEYYRSAVERAGECNYYLVSPMAQGLVALLNNTSVQNADTFVTEAFIMYEQGNRDRLKATQEFLTLATDASRQRYRELLATNTAKEPNS